MYSAPVCWASQLVCVFYLSGQEITFSRSDQWGHKGLWVIGNPDGWAWASRKRRLLRRSNWTCSKALMLLISVCVPLLFFYFFLGLPIFLKISALISSLLLCSSSIGQLFSWPMSATGPDRKSHTIQGEWVGPEGAIN